MTIHNFRELAIWQRSMDIAVRLYKVSSQYPNEELYGLTSQSRRAAISVPSNIAEGSGRRSNKEFARFLNISLASAYELETQLILAQRLFLDSVDLEEIDSIISELTEIQKMIFVFTNKVSNNN